MPTRRKPTHSEVIAHRKRRVEYNCTPGSKFNYFCDDCSLDLFGWDNKNDNKAANGWTWVLKRHGEEIASAGNRFARSFGGTESKALKDGLKRFDKERCVRPN